MDNFSPKTTEKKIDAIQFDEVFDIDEIQKKLKDQMEQGDFDEELTDETEEPMLELEIKPKNQPVESNSPSIDTNAKKYVIYINAENIDFIENLSANERRELINKILREQNELSVEEKKNQERNQFLKHLLLSVATFIIFFPILFIYVNKALLITIDNYQQATENFAKLYKEQGKIKRTSPENVPNIKY